MNYYALYHLYKEPFANSPDPDLFYYSVQHHNCLQKLELALRLRRGLSVVIGDIGTGKSTMCRTLIRQLDNDSDTISAHIILDPAFTSPSEFLAAIITTFSIEDECSSDWQMKEAIKNYLLQQAVEYNVIPALIIDEGQKLPGFCIEILREFLNFETNRNKLLEIVIFAQKEFIDILKKRPNFSDRITTYHNLGPLSFRETRQMVRYRVEKCRLEEGDGQEIFPYRSLLLIFLLSKGYPRKIVMLCSKILLAMVVKEKKRASMSLVWNCARETSIPLMGGGIPKSIYATGLLLLLTAGILLSGESGKILAKVQGFLPQQQIVEPQAVTTQPMSEAELITQIVEMLPAPAAGPVPPPISVPPPTVEAVSDPVISEDVMVQEVSVEPVLPAPPAPVPISAQAPTELPPSSPPPLELGYLTVRDGTSMSWMLSRVYGRYKPRDLRRVLKANPYITDPAKLIVDSRIFFPRLQNSETSELAPLLIRLGRFTTLQEAYDFLITCPKLETPARIMPIWGGAPSLSFLVVLGESFPGEREAQEALASLDERLRPVATILNELQGIPL